MNHKHTINDFEVMSLSINDIQAIISIYCIFSIKSILILFIEILVKKISMMKNTMANSIVLWPTPNELYQNITNNNHQRKYRNKNLHHHSNDFVLHSRCSTIIIK